MRSSGHSSPGGPRAREPDWPGHEGPGHPTPAGPGQASAPHLLRGALNPQTHMPLCTPHPRNPREGHGMGGPRKGSPPTPDPLHSEPPNRAGSSPGPAGQGPRSRGRPWPCPRPHLNGHVGAVSIEVIVLPIEGDVVAVPIDGTGAMAHGLGARPAPFLAGAEESEMGAWRGCRGPGPPPLLSVYPGAVRKAPQQLTDHTSRPSYPSPHPGQGPADPSRSHGRDPHGALGAGGRGAHQVLQSTLILSPGEYRSLLCTHGHASSTTQPPRPSSTSPSGHTQPLTHSVWY